MERTTQEVMTVNVDIISDLTGAVTSHAENRMGEDQQHCTTAPQTASPPEEAGLMVYATPGGPVTALTGAPTAEVGPGVTANLVSPGLNVTETTWTTPHAK